MLLSWRCLPLSCVGKRLRLARQISPSHFLLPQHISASRGLFWDYYPIFFKDFWNVFNLLCKALYTVLVTFQTLWIWCSRRGAVFSGHLSDDVSHGRPWTGGTLFPGNFLLPIIVVQFISYFSVHRQGAVCKQHRTVNAYTVRERHLLQTSNNFKVPRMYRFISTFVLLFYYLKYYFFQIAMLDSMNDV